MNKKLFTFLTLSAVFVSILLATQGFGATNLFSATEVDPDENDTGNFDNVPQIISESHEMREILGVPDYKYVAEDCADLCAINMERYF